MAGGGLSQEDFRKLLATPRPDAKPASQGEGAAADGFAAPAQKKKKKKWEKLTKVIERLSINGLSSRPFEAFSCESVSRLRPNAMTSEHSPTSLTVFRKNKLPSPNEKKRRKPFAKSTFRRDRGAYSTLTPLCDKCHPQDTIFVWL